MIIESEVKELCDTLGVSDTEARFILAVDQQVISGDIVSGPRPQRHRRKKSTSHRPSQFNLYFKDIRVGDLTLDDGLWTFKYSDEFRRASNLQPIVEFPDPNSEYHSHALWPFFALRIPGLNQPSVKETIAKETIDQTDLVDMLDRFGRRTISNPYELRHA